MDEHRRASRNNELLYGTIRKEQWPKSPLYIRYVCSGFAKRRDSSCKYPEIHGCIMEYHTHDWFRVNQDPRASTFWNYKNQIKRLTSFLKENPEWQPEQWKKPCVVLAKTPYEFNNQRSRYPGLYKDILKTPGQVRKAQRVAWRYTKVNLPVEIKTNIMSYI